MKGLWGRNKKEGKITHEEVKNLIYKITKNIRKGEINNEGDKKKKEY